jgi:hypothetical protein
MQDLFVREQHLRVQRMLPTLHLPPRYQRTFRIRGDCATVRKILSLTRGVLFGLRFEDRFSSVLSESSVTLVVIQMLLKQKMPYGRAG